jgi:hypothetical protein
MAAKKKPDASALVAAALAKHGFPKPGGRGLCFAREDDERFARGYPAMRLLSDEPTTDAKAFAIAIEALDAIDPCLRITVARPVARLFLLGYSVGPCLFPDAYGPEGPANARLRPEREALMRSDRAIDVALLDTALSRHGVAMGDTYAKWRWPKVVFLYEAFLGTEPVARALVLHLVREADDLSRWGTSGDPHRTNTSPYYLALALPWLLLRLDAAKAKALRDQLARARKPSDDEDEDEPRAYLELLQQIAGRAPRDERNLPLALRGDDAAVLARCIDRAPAHLLLNAGRVAWMLGTARFAGKLEVTGLDLPLLIDQIAPIRDAAIVRLVARVAGQRAGRQAAGDWLRRHADYARPILETLARVVDDKEKKHAAAALALAKEATPKPVRKPTRKELEAEITAIFADLKKQLKRAKGEAKQRAAIRDAHERYTEARSAAGDANPDAYFTHRFGDFDLGEWGELAADSID